MTAARDERGVTLVEALTAVVLGSLLVGGLVVLFQSAQRAQVRALEGQALEMASVYLQRILIPAVNAATCAEVSRGGRVLLLSLGRDCRRDLVLEGEDRYAVACLGPSGQVLYAAGEWGSAFQPSGPPTASGSRLLDCDPGYPGWRRLTLPGVRAEGGFSLPPGARNQVRMDFALRQEGLPGRFFAATATYSGAL